MPLTYLADVSADELSKELRRSAERDADPRPAAARPQAKDRTLRRPLLTCVVAVFASLRRRALNAPVRGSVSSHVPARARPQACMLDDIGSSGLIQHADYARALQQRRGRLVG